MTINYIFIFSYILFFTTNCAKVVLEKDRDPRSLNYEIQTSSHLDRNDIDLHQIENQGDIWTQEKYDNCIKLSKNYKPAIWALQKISKNQLNIDEKCASNADPPK